jgi:hypothetical protein
MGEINIGNDLIIQAEFIAFHSMPALARDM